MKIRSIVDQDRAEVVDLLCEGFSRRNRNYWLSCWNYLSQQFVPPGQPRYGLAMEESKHLEGVILNLWTPSVGSVEAGNRANLSSWYVKPQFRSYAGMLLARATRDARTTYLNVSPAAHTLAICEALGFKRYSGGQNVSVPFLSRTGAGAKVYPFSTEMSGLGDDVKAVIEAHIALGCLAAVADVQGQRYPMLFVKRKVKPAIPVVQMVYGPSDVELRTFFQSLGRYLAKTGHFLLITDSDEAHDFAPCRHYPGRGARYFKGPVVPRQGDLTFTEIVAFGL